MIVRKVCLMGAYAVGKTSLVRRFVHQAFDDSYKTTLGVSIDTKLVELNGETVKMVIWDFEGQHPSNNESAEFTNLLRSYLNGAAGIILVGDGTRLWTVDSALEMHVRYMGINPSTPSVLLINKSDLKDQWKMDKTLPQMPDPFLGCFKTSALDGENVEMVFQKLARLMAKSS